MRAVTIGANSPAEPGMLVAAESNRGALFVWETADDRFCHGAALEFSDITVGEVTVHVRRGSRVVTEYLASEQPERAGDQDLARCGSAQH